MSWQNIKDVDCGTLLQNIKRYIGDASDVSFYRKKDEAHICICAIAYKVYKELERLIDVSQIDMSVDNVLDTAKTITIIKIKMPKNDAFFTKTLFLTDKHLNIKPLFDLHDNNS